MLGGFRSRRTIPRPGLRSLLQTAQQATDAFSRSAYAQDRPIDTVVSHAGNFRANELDASHLWGANTKREVKWTPSLGQPDGLLKS